MQRPETRRAARSAGDAPTGRAVGCRETAQIRGGRRGRATPARRRFVSRETYMSWCSWTISAVAVHQIRTTKHTSGASEEDDA